MSCPFAFEMTESKTVRPSNPHDWHWWLQLFVQAAGIGVVLWVIKKAYDANRISMKAVKAAEESIEVARDIGNKQLRAYIHVEKIGIDPTSAQRPVINYQVRNFGQTPAQNIAMKQAMSIGAFPLTTELYEELLAAAVDQGGRISLGPGDIIGTSLSPKPTPLTDAQIAQVQAGTMAVYMLVEHEYEDMFGERHFSRICVYTNGIGYGVSPDMHAAKMGNEIG